MKRAIKCSATVLTAICAVIFGLCTELYKTLPGEITAYKDEKISFNNFSTVHADNQSKKEKTDNGLRQTSEEIDPIDNGSSVDDSLTYTGKLELFNIIPIKDVTVHQTEKKYVIPCGTLFGIKFYAKGAAVIECCDIEIENESVNPGKESGLKAGDTICSIDGVEIEKYSDVERLTAQSGGKPLHLSCLRNGQQFETVITPAAVDGSYRLGLWIKDSAAGLGTMTFFDPDSGCFASLGHGICDSETGELMELEHAELTKVNIAGITKGADGSPGSMNGYFSDSPSLGSATVNNECGLFGTLNYAPSSGTPLEIAPISEIKKGKAQILCTVDNGQPQLYDIEITKVDYDEKNKTKNLQIIVTDERLTDKTGGIIQGMSGCPILQNGKLVGAVTHVLITNSAKGYGIFAQNMFDEMEKAQNILS